MCVTLLVLSWQTDDQHYLQHPPPLLVGTERVFHPRSKRLKARNFGIDVVALRFRFQRPQNLGDSIVQHREGISLHAQNF
jgi:hypothetical protein